MDARARNWNGRNARRDAQSSLPGAADSRGATATFEFAGLSKESGSRWNLRFRGARWILDAFRPNGADPFYLAVDGRRVRCRWRGVA